MTALWDRRFYAVQLRTGKGPDAIIGEAWDNRYPTLPQQPSRALLFTTRQAARTWCRRRNDEWQQNPATRQWRARPVRVRETVSVMTTKGRG